MLEQRAGAQWHRRALLLAALLLAAFAALATSSPASATESCWYPASPPGCSGYGGLAPNASAYSGVWTVNVWKVGMRSPTAPTYKKLYRYDSGGTYIDQKRDTVLYLEWVVPGQYYYFRCQNLEAGNVGARCSAFY